MNTTDELYYAAVDKIISELKIMKEPEIAQKINVQLLTMTNSYFKQASECIKYKLIYRNGENNE